MILARYKKGRLLAYGLAWFPMGLLCLAGGPLGVIIGLFVWVAGIGFLKTALGSSAALEAKREGLVVRGQWTSKTVPWNELVNIRTRTHTHYLFYVIPVKKNHFLIIDTTGGIFGGTAKKELSLSVIDIGLDDVPALASQIQRMANSNGTIVPGQGGSYPPIDVRGDGGPTPDAFDPDAALARYMARRQIGSGQGSTDNVLEVPRSSSGAARGGFGRKGL